MLSGNHFHDERGSERRSSLADFSKINFEYLKSFPHYEGFSKCIPNMTEEDFYDFLRFMRRNDKKHGCFYDRNTKSIVITRMGHPSARHESNHGCISGAVSLYNHMLSGVPVLPITYGGSLTINVGTRIVSADAQFSVPKRPYPNMVVESADTQTLAELIRKLKAYIDQTDYIMFALGFKFLPVYNGIALLAIGYSREHGTQHPLFVINFGTASVSRQAERSILQVAQIPDTQQFTGLGYGDMECTMPNMKVYRIEVPREWLLCTDFVGVQLFEFEHADTDNHQNLIIDLFHVRSVFFVT